MFCSSLCQWGEFSKEEWELFDSHFEESRARNAAQAEADEAHAWQEQQLAHEEEEEEERRGLSLETMIEEEAMPTYDEERFVGDGH